MQEKWNVPKLDNYDDLRGNWNGCLLVNPLCPDDLCWLPAEPGHNHQWHCLGSDPWDHRFTVGGTAFFMSKVARDEHDLYVEGWQRQFKLVPHELEFRRQVWDRKIIEEILAYPNPASYTSQVRRHGHEAKDVRLNRRPNDPKRGFPCWCGETMVGRYRQMVVCCVDYLLSVAPAIYLDLTP